VELWKAVILGIVEGLTEFLPVSSTGHLTITERLLDLKTDDASVTGFTAVIQVGAIVAAIIYFFRDIVRIVKGFVLGLFSSAHRDFDYRFGWYVIVGSLPIAIVGVVAKDAITGPLRSLWVVASALILWSAVMVYAEKAGRKTRGEKDVNLTDAVIIGVMQSAALFPGVSRSGATISFGLLRDLDRVTATRLSFFWGYRRCWAAGPSSSRTPCPGRRSGYRRCSWGPSSASSSGTPRSPGCCASWPGTRSSRSSGTGWRSAS
jgi:undecaprenyl-diphosphatase